MGPLRSSTRMLYRKSGVRANAGCPGEAERIDKSGERRVNCEPERHSRKGRTMGMLDGRVAICTGAARGVGAEVAKLMAAEGAKIVVVDPGVGGAGEGGDQRPAQVTVDEIKAAGGEAVANYGTAKFGVVALARIVAMENQSRGITANVIAPSADTRMTRSVPTPKDPAAAAMREERLRRSRADAIAPLCVFLASEQASYVNGQVFHQRAGELSLYGHMRPVRMVHRNGGWTPETIAEVAMPSLASGFTSLDSRNTHAGLPME